jgi:hypothetical protein
MDRARQMRRQRYEKRHFVLVECAMGLFPRREDAKDTVVVDEGHAEKAAVARFGCAGREGIRRMARDIRHHDQFATFRDEIDGALGTDCVLTRRGGLEAFGGH